MLTLPLLPIALFGLGLAVPAVWAQSQMVIVTRTDVPFAGGMGHNDLVRGILHESHACAVTCADFEFWRDPPGQADVKGTTGDWNADSCLGWCFGSQFWTDSMQVQHIDGFGTIDLYKVGGGNQIDDPDTVYDAYLAGQGHFLGKCWYDGDADHHKGYCPIMASHVSWAPMLWCEFNRPWTHPGCSDAGGCPGYSNRPGAC